MENVVNYLNAIRDVVDFVNEGGRPCEMRSDVAGYLSNVGLLHTTDEYRRAFRHYQEVIRRAAASNEYLLQKKQELKAAFEAKMGWNKPWQIRDAALPWNKVFTDEVKELSSGGRRFSGSSYGAATVESFEVPPFEADVFSDAYKLGGAYLPDWFLQIGAVVRKNLEARPRELEGRFSLSARWGILQWDPRPVMAEHGDFRIGIMRPAIPLLEIIAGAGPFVFCTLVKFQDDEVKEIWPALPTKKEEKPKE